tara:strand:- start:236 stop:979 length:744 start_codon:yes stop_codon:yes gene_type:complete
MNSKIYIANWKMNITSKESKSFFDEFHAFYNHKDNKKVIFCPSYTTLLSAIQLNSYIKENNIYFGAQNVSDMPSGAFTGEISASMLKDIGLDYCIVGHSERRSLFNESSKIVNNKIKLLTKSNIIPILCIGETLKQKENSKGEDVITNQLSVCLEDIPASKIIIAYEPVWAIGTGKNAGIEDISSMNNVIKNHMNKLGYLNDQFYILYGGSVNIDNLSVIIKSSFLDGFLIGGASLDAQNFWNIINS